MSYQHLFGPVQSRRLGVSLGVDLIPYKTCTLDCVYCECGATTDLTCERKNFIPTEKIKAELKDFLANKPQLDHITFSGAGEPTLAKNIGEIIAFIKSEYPQYKLVLLTNGTLLYLPEVRAEIKKCDLVKISLDAVSQEIFQKVNRPDQLLDINKILNGIIKFSQEYSGRIFLEIFIVPDINDQEPELKKLKEIAQQIKHEQIQINSLDRLGAEDWVKPESPEKLQKIAEFFQPLNVQVIAPLQSAKKKLDRSKRWGA